MKTYSVKSAEDLSERGIYEILFTSDGRGEIFKRQALMRLLSLIEKGECAISDCLRQIEEFQKPNSSSST